MLRNIIGNIVNWFLVAKPEPTPRDVVVQIGVHFEEVSEMVASLKGNDRTTQSLLTAAMLANHSLALHLKNEKNVKLDINPLEFLDACCDQIVTATGSAVFFKQDLEGALGEVDRSNWSKFVDGKPVLNETGKIIKGPLYSPPNLNPFK